MIGRLIGVQGWIGLAASLGLLAMLLVARSEVRHWRKQATAFEQLYRGEQAAFAGTVANYRAAADAARHADALAATRAAAEQGAINRTTEENYESRLADARARSRQLRRSAASAADPGAGRGAPLPGLPAAAERIVEAAGKDRLSRSDRLIATEQAIQLDELIQWVRRQAAVDPNATPRD